MTYHNGKRSCVYRSKAYPGSWEAFYLPNFATAVLPTFDKAWKWLEGYYTGQIGA